MIGMPRKKQSPWSKRFELLLSIPAVVLEDIAEFVGQYYEAIIKADKKKTPLIKRKKK